MKRTITHLFLGIALMVAFQAHAQYCGSQNTQVYAAPIAYGFGDVATLPCITAGQYDSIVIPFKVYQQFQVGSINATIYKLRINEIDSLPCGLCWSTSQSTTSGNGVNEFSPSDTGCIKISGLTNDAPGSYKLYMTLAVRDQPTTTSGYDIDTIPSNAGGIVLWVKVISATGQCPTTLDTTNPSHTNCVTNGIRPISSTLTALSIQPNPMSGEAKVTFTSETAGTQQISIADVLGRVVYSTTMTARQGQNETTIERNNLPAGVYILSVGNKEGTATKKFIIED
jgi:hypothetical protein